MTFFPDLGDLEFHLLANAQPVAYAQAAEVDPPRHDILAEGSVGEVGDALAHPSNAFQRQ
jgi:hypothetical protein